MILEERVYTLQSGKVKEYLGIVQEHLLPVQREILGGFIGYFYPETGVLNQVVHMWAYDSMGERERRRETLASLASWSSLVAMIRPLIVTQESRILSIASFSPLLAQINASERHGTREYR